MGMMEQQTRPIFIGRAMRPAVLVELSSLLRDRTPEGVAIARRSACSRDDCTGKIIDVGAI